MFFQNKIFWALNPDDKLGQEPSSFNNSFGSPSSAGYGNLNLEREGVQHRYGAGTSGSLFMFQATNDPGVGGSRPNLQVTVNQNHYFESLGHCNASENDPIAITTTYRRSDGSILRNSNGNGNPMAVSSNFGQMGGSSIPKDQSLNKGDGTFKLMGKTIVVKGNSGLSPTDQQHKSYNGNSMPFYSAHNQGQPSFTRIADTACNSNKFSSPLMGQIFNKVVGPALPPAAVQDETGGGSLVSGSDLLISQNPIQASEEPAEEDSMENSNNQSGSGAPTAIAKSNGAAKKIKKEPKPKKERKPRIYSNKFPSNVKSLLSTGIFNGVPVMYVSWSRETKLVGVIKDSGYLCTCKKCDLAKPLSAYEFESHAGGVGTKHPNNHIYFENGKTIYEVVQILRKTPPEKLFDTILTVTGSPIHEINFFSWKASYEAASRELQRIYAEDGVGESSSHGNS